MIVETTKGPINGLCWSDVSPGKTYQNTDQPKLVAVAFIHQPDNSKTDLIMALPVTHYNDEKIFVAFHPSAASRWVEVESKVKIQLKV